MLYRVTIQYTTPSGKASTYTETIGGASMQLAIDTVKAWLHIEPRRKVKRIEHWTVEMV